MSIAAFCLGLVRSLPPSPAIVLSRILVLLYLAFRPDCRDEIRLNAAVLGCRVGRWFWLKNGWRVGRNLALMTQIGRRLGGLLVDRAIIVGENNIRAILEQDLHAAMASFHFGAWEFLPRAFARFGRQVTVVTGIQRQAKLAWMLDDMRQTRGVRIAHTLLDLARMAHQPQIVGFMLDNTSRVQRVWPESGTVRFGMPGLPFRLQTAVGRSRCTTKERQGDREVEQCHFQEERSARGRLVPVFAYLSQGKLRVVAYPPGDERNALEALLAQVRARPEEWVFWGKAGAVQTTADAL